MQDIMLGWTVGPMELILILVVAIFFFGPKRLPEIGEAMGKTLKSFKSASSEEKEKEKPALQEPKSS